MKAERLIELFERVGEAPGAVTKLRALVLDIALRGRLVLQDPADEPIAKTLREVDRRRAARAGNASVANQRDAENEAVVRPPHSVPESWQWVALGQVSDIFMGQSPPGHSYNKRSEGLPLINGPVEFAAGPFGRTVINQFTTEPTVLCDEGDLLVCVRGSTTGRTNIASCHACIGRGVAAIRPYVPESYLRLVIWRLRDAIIGMGRGIAFPSVSRAQLQALPVPLPPLAEQQRIVARVHELMALCDQLEWAQAARERQRDRLVTASLQRLREPVEDGVVFREQASFHLRHMGRMTTRVEHVREMREAVLAMAVRGVLSTQVPSEEALPGNAAGVRVAVAQGEDRVSPAIESPFRLPDGWEWRLMSDCFHVTGGIQKSPKRAPSANAYPYVGVSNVYRGRLDLTTLKQFEIAPDELDRYRLHPRDLLVVEGNGSASEIGRCALWNGEVRDCVHQNHIIRCRPKLNDIEPFALLYLNSPLGIEQMKRLAVTSSGLFNLSVGKIKAIPLPVPPAEERAHIVERTAQIVKVCEQLVPSLSETSSRRSALLDAVLFSSVNTVKN